MPELETYLKGRILQLATESESIKPEVVVGLFVPKPTTYTKFMSLVTLYMNQLSDEGKLISNGDGSYSHA